MLAKANQAWRMPRFKPVRRSQRRDNAGQGRPASLVITESFSPGLDVDVGAGVIRNVKVLGFYSRNGRRYNADAVRKAAKLYEGIAVNVDHPAKKPTESRSSFTRYAWLENIRFDPDPNSGGLRGDLHFLLMEGINGAPPEPDEFQRRVMWAAKNHPESFGLSHNADGDVRREGDIDVIHEITEVRSVDLVADPATTRSLQEAVMPKLETKTKQQLLEMGYKVEEEGVPIDGVAEDDGAPEPDAMDHIYAAFKKLKDEDPERALELLKHLEAECEMEDEGDGEDDMEEADETGGGEQQGKPKDTGDEEKDTKEGRKFKTNGGDKALIERLCKNAGLKTTPQIMAHLEIQPGLTAVLEAIELLKPVNPGRSSPRSASAAHRNEPITEDDAKKAKQQGGQDIPKDHDARMRWLMS